jgi:hypothetical protein
VRIAVPATGETFEAQLEEDEFHMLWLNEPNRKGRRRGGICCPRCSRSDGVSCARHPRSRRCWTRHGLRSGRGAVTMELSLYSIVSAGESPCPTLQRL